MRYARMEVVHSAFRKRKARLEGRGAREIAGVLKDGRVAKYAVVRNPLVRTLSAFLDKVGGDVGAFQKWVRREFAGGGKLDPHWRAQVEFCGFRVRDVGKYLKVFRAEQAGEYVRFLEKVLPAEFLRDGWGGRRNVSFGEFVLGPRERTGFTESVFWRYFNSVDVFDFLSERLEEDIRLLGYGKDVRDMRVKLIGDSQKAILPISLR